MNEYLKEKLRTAVQSLGVTSDAVVLEKPRQPEHGDVTTNVALVLAKRLGRSSRQLATDILERMEIDPSLVAKAEAAGPGFINFTYADRFYRHQLHDLIVQGGAFGRSNVAGGKKTMVEFVSANPTGPLTVGHGRGAVLGDTVSNLLEWTGHDVTREYYFNDAGRQMRILGDSVRLRYLELLGAAVDFPADYYQGEYIKDIARHLQEQHGDALRDEPAEGFFKDRAEQEIFGDIKRTLTSLGIEFQSYYNEHSLYENGHIDEVVDQFRKRGLAYDRDGAIWFKASALGGEKDKVIIKSSGEPTYRLPDIAYHREKFRRGYELMIDVFGADHVATYPDVLAGVRALGYDTANVKVLIHQFVTIVQQGEVVKMSTRKANFITLDELIAEVGADVVRYFFLMRTATSHLNFDLGLAKQQSDENPVFYLQYAHARISSILRYAHEMDQRTNGNASGVDYDLLSTPEEMELTKTLLMLPETVESCALSCEPHRLADYLHSVAGTFHKFYHCCRVVSDDAALTSARLALCHATRIVLRNGLSILGISAPEQM